MVHLHTHTHYSTLDGLCQIPELVARAKELGQTAIGITDHGNMCNVYDLYKQCKKENIQPVYGIEFYHIVEGIDKRLHLTAWAKSMRGLKNLYKLHELSHKNKVKGAFGKLYPVITYSDLLKYKQDIIVGTACLAGHIPYCILNNQYNDIYITLEMLQNHFGDDFYIELQSNTLQEQKKVNKELLQLASLYKIKTILTCDTHYILQSDAKVHEMLLCMQTQDKMDNPKRFKFSTNDFWLKSEEEMISTTTGIGYDEIMIAISNTHEVAEKCKFELELPKPEDVLPRFSDDENTELRKLCNGGWNKTKHNKTKVEIDRAKYELDVVESKGYSGYFLIVADYINWAKNNNVIVGGGRGSAAGSFVAYLTGITTLDPISNGLLFERFLNPERMSSPDVDTDFSDRDSVVQYLKERWGYENTSAIIAFGTLTAKAVFRKILSIHGFSMAEINEISKSFPRKLELTLNDCENSELFRLFKQQHPELVHAMYRLEDTIDHTSQHAAGILITPQAIREFIPTLYDDANDILVAGFDKYMLEELGMYKFDILKLKTLDIIDDTIKLVKQHKGIDIDMINNTHDDIEVYNDLCDGNVFGVFQLEEQATMTRELQPRTFDALTALNALIRPGTGNPTLYKARMNGEPFEYYHDVEREYMESTYNTITYQEQIMMRVNKLAGWSLGKGDSLRKVKNIRDNTDLSESFLSDCMEVGRIKSPDVIQNVWNEIVDALDGGYSFNRSHAASYADISYQTAWLKHYYPVEFMTALMTCERDDQEQIAKRVTQCKELDIKILPPDINKSSEIYQIENNCIRYSINTIKNVGVSALEEIKRIKSEGAIQSMHDLYTRGNLRVLDKTTMCNLIKSGCFDFENINRYELLRNYYALRKEKKIPDEYLQEQCTDVDVASMEKQVLGLYLTKSPFDNYNFKPLTTFPNQSRATIGGEISKLKVITDKKGRKMAFITLTTQYNNLEVVVFATQYAEYESVLTENSIVMIQGKNDNGKVLLDTIKLLR